MKINWLLFVPALLLLFYPLDHLLPGRIRLRSYESIRNDPLGARDAWWRQPWIWINPLRSCAGGWLLHNAWTIEPPLPGFWRHLPFFGTLLVLALAMGVQMHTRRADDVLLAPVGYSAGIVFALLPPEIAVLVIMLAGACLMAFRSWSAFFFCGAVGALAFGYLILRWNFWMLATVVLMIEPVVLSLLAKRELLFPVLRAHARVVARREISAEVLRVSSR